MEYAPRYIILVFIGDNGHTLDCQKVIKSPKQSLFEPQHEISNNVVCATSKASDQPAHTLSLIRVFSSRLNVL